MEEQKKENQKKHRNTKKYPMWDNCRYAFRQLCQKEGKGALGACCMDVGLGVLLPFLETALAGAVAACLVSGRQPGEILLLIGGYVVLLQTVRFLQGYISALKKKVFFMMRIDMGADFFRKTVEMDGQSLESARGQKKWEAARRNIYSGNGVGIEAYVGNYCELLLQLMGLAVYTVIVGRVSLPLLLLLIGLTILVSFSHTRAGKRAYKMEDEIEKNWGAFQYLRRETLAPGSGKDIRLYRMDKWFLGLFHKWIDRICVLIDRQRTGYMAAGIGENLLTFGRGVIVYGWLIREMALGNMALPEFLLYVGVVGGFGAWMSGLARAWQGILENERLIDDYRDFMDFGSLPELIFPEAQNAASAGIPSAVQNSATGRPLEQNPERTQDLIPAQSPAAVRNPAAVQRLAAAQNSVSVQSPAAVRSPETELSPAQVQNSIFPQAGSAHELRLENVSFRYEGNEEDTIHDLNLIIRPGEKLALVGLNGAGKTTLIKLLCGLYRPTSGMIRLDGRDMQSLSRREIFREFAVVFQDVFAFSFPLADNVSCVNAGQENGEKLRESLEKAGLWERVQEFPERERTMMNKDLDEAGVSLSGGELQKLMLARALYKEASMVILDEPTAALDPIAEGEMYEKYDELIQGRTAVFISHRLSSTRFCDRILFMEKGRIIQEGTHGELMETGGAYAELFALQARYYQEKNREEEQYA